MTAPAAPKRDPWERYYTPAWSVDRLLDRLAVDRPHVIEGETWAEPACGDGAIVRAVDAWYARHRLEPRRWWLNDIRPPAAVRALPWTVRRLNFVRAELDDFACCAVGITNPPYRLALRFVQRMLELHSTPILLLRLNWLEGAEQEEPERAELLRTHPPDVYVLPNRPAFRRRAPRTRKTIVRGTDATAYAWMVWARSPDEPPTWSLLDHTPREERQQGHRWTPSARDLGPHEPQTCERCGLRRRREVTRTRSGSRTVWTYAAADVRGWHALAKAPRCDGGEQ